MSIHDRTSTKRHLALWLTLFTSLFLAGAAGAVEHQVFGRVVQVSDDDAADETISDADLTGDPRPYGYVRIYDAETRELLGDDDTNETGLFSVTFDKPADYTPNIRCQAVQLVVNPGTGTIETEILSPARSGINTFSSVPRYFMTRVKIRADDVLEYGGEQFTDDPGVGLVITEVGKVEAQFIVQDTTARGGLADFTGAPSAASDAGVPAFRDAPFAGTLSIFGGIGKPGMSCDPAGSAPPPPPDIDYYQVQIRKVGDPTGKYWKQPLRKTRTRITTRRGEPSLIEHERVSMGPFNGSEAGSSVEGLYWVNRDTGTDFYSFAALRIKWSTENWQDGLYELSFKYYHHESGPVENPTVEELAPSCFDPPMAPANQLYLRIDNQPPVVSIDNVYLKDPSGNYFAGAGSTVPTAAGAFDFNAVGLCDIMELEGTYGVEIHFTAHHPGGYMGSYWLTAKPNAGTPVTFVTAVYPGPTDGSPAWTGTPASRPPAPRPPPIAVVKPFSDFVKCGYIFGLHAWTRQQNGDNYIYKPSRTKVWYVVP